MKKALLLLALTWCVVITAKAQAVNTRIVLNESTVVKDSAGVIYAYNTWKDLMSTGKYRLKPIAGTDPLAFTLLRVNGTAQQGTPMLRKPSESEFFTTGETFKLFSEKDMKGEKLSIKALAGKVIVLNFWFINCPPCRAEIPELNKLVEKYKGNTDVVFIAMALDSKEALEVFLKAMPFDYHIIDNARYLADKYGVKSYPTNVIVDRDGKVKFHNSGYGAGLGTATWMEKLIEEALAEKTKAAL